MNLFIFTSSAHCSQRISLKFLSVFRRFMHSNSSFSPKDKPDFKWRIPQNSPNRLNFPPQSIPLDIYGCNVKITSLGRQGKVGQARKVFDEMPKRDIVSYAALITVYLKNGYLSNAEKVFKTMPGSSLVASSAMIDGYAKAKRMNEAREIFDIMPERNVVSWTSLISGYLRAGQTDVARQLFYRMAEKNEFSWTTMILRPEHYSCLVDLLGRMGHVNETVELVNQMPKDKREGAVLGALLGACKLHGDIEVANQIATELIEMEPSSSAVTHCWLICMRHAANGMILRVLGRA